MSSYPTPLHHILAELERIDLLIRLQVWRTQQLQINDPEFQGLYITEEEIVTLLDQPLGLPRWATEETALTLEQGQAVLAHLNEEITRRKRATLQEGLPLPLEQLRHAFNLTPFEIDILLICLAPELDLRYERLFAYLQNDASKKNISVDLVLNLISPSLEVKLMARQHFQPQAPLRRHRLLQLLDPPDEPHPPLLGQLVKIEARITDYLLGLETIETRLQAYTHLIIPQADLDSLHLPPDFKARLKGLGQARHLIDQGLVLYCQGPYGLGQQTVAEALCQRLGLKLLVVNGEAILSNQSLTFETTLRLLQREAILTQAALYCREA